MRITQQFEVNRPVDVVWDFFQDIPAMTECIAGAELTDPDEGVAGVHPGRLALKLGAMKATFVGTVRITPDEPGHSGVLEARGEDRPGKSRGSISLRYALAPARPTTTAVTIDAELTLTGAVAQFARPAVVADLSNHLASEFVRRLEYHLDVAETLGAQGDQPTQVVLGPAPVHRSFRNTVLVLRQFLHDRPQSRSRR